MSTWFIRRANITAGGSQPEPPAPSYVANGLVFHLDGIDKGNTAGAWTDLVSGTVIQGTNVVSTQYGWEFDGTAYFVSSYILTGSADHTLEVCFKPTITGRYALFVINKQTQYNLMFFKDSSTVTWLQRSNTYSFTLSANTPYSISLNLDGGLYNGTAVSKNSGTDYWSNTETLQIGRRSSGDYFKGDIYSIRIYNRRLTAAEQLNNFNVDNSRFNLGI